MRTNPTWRTKLLAVLLMLMVTFALSPNGSAQSSTTLSTTGQFARISNAVHSLTVTVGYVIHGSPLTVNLTYSGCTNNGTCTILDTYTTVADTYRHPVISATYDYFKVTGTWTGGSNVAIVVTSYIGPAPAVSPGNVPTATALAATPTQCPGGQFATGITATGNAICSVVPAGASAIAYGATQLTNGSTLIGSGTCAAPVTVSAPGADPTSPHFAIIPTDFNSDPSLTGGWIPSSSGVLTIYKWVSANQGNFKVCNDTGLPVTPGIITANWQVEQKP